MQNNGFKQKHRAQREDNLSTMDKWPVPKLSSLRRFYCTMYAVEMGVCELPYLSLSAGVKDAVAMKLSLGIPADRMKKHPRRSTRSPAMPTYITY